MPARALRVSNPKPIYHSTYIDYIISNNNAIKVSLPAEHYHNSQTTHKTAPYHSAHDTRYVQKNNL